MYAQKLKNAFVESFFRTCLHGNEFDHKSNSYFGTFELVLQNIDGVEMGETRERYRIILKNNLNEPLNVTMTLIDSEDAPTGEDNIGKDIKVLVRGEPNEFDLSYGYTSMEKNKAISYALKSTGAIGAASSQQIILGVDRTNSTGNPSIRSKSTKRRWEEPSANGSRGSVEIGGGGR